LEDESRGSTGNLWSLFLCLKDNGILLVQHINNDYHQYVHKATDKRGAPLQAIEKD
jgi:hypothetical protein